LGILFYTDNSMNPKEIEDAYITEQDKSLRKAVYGLLGVGGLMAIGYRCIVKQYDLVLSTGIVGCVILAIVVGIYFAKPAVPRTFQLARIARANGWYDKAPVGKVSSALYYKHYSKWNSVGSIGAIYGED
jgi:hypothetical protein